MSHKALALLWLNENLIDSEHGTIVAHCSFSNARSIEGETSHGLSRQKGALVAMEDSAGLPLSMADQ